MRTLWLGILALAITLGSVRAATVEQAWDTDGHYRWILKVEGSIEPGDANKLRTKLLDYFNIFGSKIETIDLASPGGDVEEAMKMGALIRRLRLKTEVAVGDPTHSPASRVVHADTDLVCASACFLIYAGGVDRDGTYLALHRPYMPRKTASQMSDLEYEGSQRQASATVTKYLQSMDIDQFWIDRMMGTNSQNAYFVPLEVGDLKSYHLQGLVPSIEEIVLAKCTDDSADLERQLTALRAADPALSPGTVAKMNAVLARSDVFAACQTGVLTEIREAAFAREAAAVFAPECSGFKDAETVEAGAIKAKVAAGTPLTSGEKSAAVALTMKQYAFAECYSAAAKPFISASWTRQSSDLRRMDARDKQGK